MKQFRFLGSVGLPKAIQLAGVTLLLAACSSAPSLEKETPAPTINSEVVMGSDTVLLPDHKVPTQVSYEIRNGKAIFEGDIVLGEVDASGKIVKEPNQDLSSQSVAIEGNAYRWPLGVIPYTINGAIPFVGVQHIFAAINEWNTKTKIRLVPWSGQLSYVEFVKGTDPAACYSAIGRRGGRQEIALTSSGDCDTGGLIHEIGHAVGFWHEQAREDRNSFITIQSQNIQPGREGQFAQHITDGFDLGYYDYDSIMHYPKWAFANDYVGCLSDISKCTIAPKNGVDPNRLGQRNGLSSTDVLTSGILNPPFYSLGGGVIGAPAVVSWGSTTGSWNSDYRAVFVRGTDNALWYKERNRNARGFLVWSQWKSLGGYITSDPAAVSWGLNRIDVFARGGNNQLVHRWLSGDYSLSWSGWESLGGILNGAPSVSSRGSKKLDVFFRGNDNQLYHKWFDGNGWFPDGWSRIENLGGQIASNPASVSWNGSRIDIFAKAPNNTLWHKWWDGAWHTPESLGGYLLSGPTVASWGPNRLDIFMRGQGDSIYHKVFDGAWRMGWEFIEGYTQQDPEAIAVGPNKLDVFVTGLDNSVWHKFWNGN